jgi:hypothetical protein
MKHYLILIALLVLAAGVRLYRLNAPLADWHSWRQADTAAVTRRYVQEGIDLLRPRYDDLSSIPSGRDNPQGYRMVEFPFVNALTAWGYQALSSALPVHVFSRLISIAFSLGSLIFLYLLVRRLSDPLTASLAAAVFALLPYNIYFSRTVLPEVPLVFFSLGMLYFAVRNQILLATILAALSLLLKPYALFLFLPIAYLGLRQRRYAYVLLCFSLIPFLLWRYWIQQFPEGIPAFTWLLNGNGIRFKGAWWRWLFADRLGRLILGYFGLIPFGLGLLVKPPVKAGWFYHVWALGILVYLIVFATGNVQHDYYQIIAIPIISIFVAKGFALLLKPPTEFSKTICYMLFAISAAFTAAFGWYHIRDYFNINHPEIVAAGLAADKLLPADAKVITPYMGDTAFLYQTNRRGWPIGGDIDAKIRLGATHYVTTTFDSEANQLMQDRKVIQKTDIYLILELNP